MRHIDALAAALLIASPAAGGDDRRSHFDVVDPSGAIIYRMTAVVKPARVDVVLADRSDYRYTYRWEQRPGESYVQRIEALDTNQSVECTIGPGRQIGFGILSEAKAEELILPTDDIDAIPRAQFDARRNLESRFLRLLEEMIGGKRDPLRFLFCRNFAMVDSELQCDDGSFLTTRPAPPDCAFDESFGFPCGDDRKRTIEDAARKGKILEIY